jgi:two-component system cell cycle response regulator
MPISPIKILLLEDNPGDARLLREALAEITESEFELTYCETVAQALESLRKHKPDVVLSDLGLPDSEGLEAVRSVHSAAPDIPIVVLTAMNDESLAVQSLQEGAQDYLVKGGIDGGSLWRALRYAMERQRVQLEVLNLALIDDLTGLNNRRGFLSLGRHHLKVAYRTRKPFLLVFVDLDGLKRINDTFGHQEGNHAIVDASNILKDSFRQSDILARLGGDEFAALIADAPDDSAETVTHRIQQKLASLNTSPGRRYDLSFSIGIVTSDTTQPTDLENLLSQADALMYEDKRNKPLSRTLASGGT